MKYLKYYISTLTLLLAIYTCSLGAFFPTAFFILFSSFIILGDIFFREDTKKQTFNNEFFLDLPMYINFPLLLFLVMMTVFFLGDTAPNGLVNSVNQFFSIDILSIKNSLHFVDGIFLIALSSLLIGIMGTVPGHELVHRKKNKLDMQMGNWLLALSWDCAFAVEHVYGHHKNVGLDKDPATAKRGENIYAFIFRAIVKEQKDAWNIFLNQKNKNKSSFISIKNKMLIGYLRSLFITVFAFLIGGLEGAMIFLLCAFIAKSLLEVINYTEHYGLVRVQGEKVRPHHSWNSNSVMSSIYLYNVTRHSSHHEKSSLKYWELRPYKGAPMMPYGYLSMLYLAIFLPTVFHRLMSKKLVEWDNKFASKNERLLAVEQNLSSGIPFLQKKSQSLDMGI